VSEDLQSPMRKFKLEHSESDQYWSRTQMGGKIRRAEVGWNPTQIASLDSWKGFGGFRIPEQE